MWFKRTDKMFEEAARNPEQLEKLIRRYRATRTSLLMFVYGAFLLLLAYGVWLVILLYPVTKALLLHDVLFPIPVSNVVLRGGLFMECVVAVTGIMALIMASISDTHVKNLLLFRALRAAGAAPVKSPA